VTHTPHEASQPLSQPKKSLSKEDWLTVGEAARILGVSAQRIGRLCAGARFLCVKFSGVWVIDRADFQRFAGVPRRPGRPPAVESVAHHDGDAEPHGTSWADTGHH